MEETKEYGIIFKINWDQIISLFSKKALPGLHKKGEGNFVTERKANLKLLVVGREIKVDHYVDWYVLILGVGLAIRGSVIEK